MFLKKKYILKKKTFKNSKNNNDFTLFLIFSIAFKYLFLILSRFLDFSLSTAKDFSYLGEKKIKIIKHISFFFPLL